jgi:hypothetical protein
MQRPQQSRAVRFAVTQLVQLTRLHTKHALQAGFVLQVKTLQVHQALALPQLCHFVVVNEEPANLSA